MTPFDGRSYQARIDAIAAEGGEMHGEANLIRSFEPTAVLDAGCGTGRLAIELARHDIEVVAVDIDPSMLAEACRLAPQLVWIEGDLARLDLGRVFDVVALAGNIPLFCAEADRPALVAACSAHVADGGVLVAGFQLGRGYDLGDFDHGCRLSGLELAERWATWDRQPFSPSSGYAVSIFQR